MISAYPTVDNNLLFVFHRSTKTSSSTITLDFISCCKAFLLRVNVVNPVYGVLQVQLPFPRLEEAFRHSSRTIDCRTEHTIMEYQGTVGRWSPGDGQPNQPKWYWLLLPATFLWGSDTQYQEIAPPYYSSRMRQDGSTIQAHTHDGQKERRAEEKRGETQHAMLLNYLCVTADSIDRYYITS